MRRRQNARGFYNSAPSSFRYLDGGTGTYGSLADNRRAPVE